MPAGKEQSTAGPKSIVLPMFRPRRVVLARALVLLAALAVALPATAGAQEPKRAVVVFWTATPVQDLDLSGPTKPDEPRDLILRHLGAQPGLALGVWSSVLGEYREEQALLDVSQGTRATLSLYKPRDPFRTTLDPATRTLAHWAATKRRAKRVSDTLRPGLLASSIPGGAGFAGVTGRDTRPAIVAADRGGHVAAVSFGPVDTLAGRTMQLSARRALVAVAVPPTPAGRAQLDALIAARSPGELLLIAHLPPTANDRALTRPPSRFYKQPAFAAAGLGEGSVRSPSTRHDGLVSGIDVMPTVLEHLGVKVPDQSRGEAIDTGPRLSAKDLEHQRRRWSDVRSGRQSASMRGVIALGLVLFLFLGALRGLRAAVAPALRITTLGLMWWPTAVLASAAVEPSTRLKETAFIGVLSILAAAITDRVARWPRGPAIPAAVGIAVYTVDLAFGGPLLTNSALGPSVAFGARFFGISNELEPLLPILLLSGLAAVMTGREITRRTPVVYALAGLFLAIVVGWGRLGADVGGVITVGMGMAVATLVMLRNGPTKRALALTALVPFVAIGGLIALDLLLSGSDHLSRNIGKASGPGDLWELVARRYELAFKVLKTGRTPAYFLGAGLAIWFAVRNREWLYGRVPHRAWTAVLVGGLAAGVAGMLTNDSGPVLLVNAVLSLATVTGYLLAGTRARALAEAPRRPDAPAPSGAPAADPVLTP
ncbi:MAG: hypothetical protein QOE65_1443 [Solirubrobacteraceae bacterium]|jgi:hypothetical protein|nr:hypothetical protein [Solirubrobacteraceae bacterium]